jgi:hypothetical protein
MMTTFEDEDDTWARELFARRARVDEARPRPSLDLDDVLARVDARARHTRVLEFARVSTLAFAAAAAWFVLVRGVPLETTPRDGVVADEGPNMTMIAPALGDGSLACRPSSTALIGDLVCAQPKRIESSSTAMAMMTSSVGDESLACNDVVTCGAIGP